MEGSPPPALSRETMSRLRDTWPGIDLSDEAFAAYVAERLEGAPLEGVSLDGLYLAAGCASGNAAAIAAFEKAFLAELAPIVRRVSAELDVDEIVQRIRTSLLVGAEGKPPKIAEYRGRGDLRGFLRVVTTRTALNAVTRRPPERATSEIEHLLEGTEQVETAEMAYFRAHYEGEVRAALPEVLASLDPRERLFLRQHYLDELTLEEMARMHQVHAATIKRQLARAREQLSEGIRERLCATLGLSPSDFESLRALIQSRLHISMRGLLPPT